MILDHRFSLTHRRITHEVCFAGEGPPVVLLHEEPCMTPACLKLASRIVRYGYCVYTPLLFGVPSSKLRLRPADVHAHLKVPTTRYRIRHEFSLLTADQSSPLTEWLRELSRIAYRQAGKCGKGVVGMCLTESSVISTVLDPAAEIPRPPPPHVPSLSRPASL